MIDGTTQIVVVIGDPISHTLSPRMHNAAFEALGMNWKYIACHVLPENVGDAVRAVRGLGLRGMNITVPHKQAVMEHLDELSPAAQAVGAVNTIINRDGYLVGDNTDVVGIIRAVENDAGVTDWPEHVVVLGAGGAARGVVYAMTTVPAVRRVTILNRTEEKAAALAAEFSGETNVKGKTLCAETARSALADTTLCINVTSLGRGSLADRTPLPLEWDCLHENLVCVDSNYSPPETLLMKHIQAAGGRAYNGIGMLVYQGARSFDLWTNKHAPVNDMRNAIA